MVLRAASHQAAALLILRQLIDLLHIPYHDLVLLTWERLQILVKAVRFLFFRVLGQTKNRLHALVVGMGLGSTDIALVLDD